MDSLLSQINALKSGENASSNVTFTKYSTDFDPAVKDQLVKGKVGGSVISLAMIQDAIEEYKRENDIYNSIKPRDVSVINLSLKGIMKISNLDILTNLVKIKLENNQILKIEGLSSLVKLTWLDLSFNQITKIEGLESLVNLTDLMLFSNKISILEGLDNCRKLSVISIGKNKLTGLKNIVDYLRRFSIRSLTINENPFIGNESSKISNEYPSSYMIFLAKLEHLKYLDYKPINPDERKKAMQSYKDQNTDSKAENKSIEDEFIKRKNEQLKMDLKKSNIEDIGTFHLELKEKIKQEIPEENYSKLKKIPKFQEMFNLAEKAWNNDFDVYKVEIFKIQSDKDDLVKTIEKGLELNIDKFTENSKAIIKEFKKDFKKLIENLSTSTTKQKQGLSYENLEEKIGLKKLKENLYNEEVYFKYKMQDKIKESNALLKNLVNLMNEKSVQLKENLDKARKNLKSHLSTNLTETLESLHKKENLTKEEEDLFEELGEEQEIKSDIEKILDVIEERINYLKDNIDSKILHAHETYINKLQQGEYERNRGRISEIEEICEMYQSELKEAITK